MALPSQGPTRRAGAVASRLLAAGAAFALLAGAGSAFALAPRAATVPAADWTTYHHDKLRTADGALHGTFTTLQPKFIWHLPASTPTDQMYASPLVVGHTAFVTTLEDRVYAVSTQTGKTLWSRTLGTPYVQPSGTCGDIGPRIGVVSTPVIDEGRGELFVVGVLGTGALHEAPVHHLFGLKLSNGAVELNRTIDPPGQQLIFLLQRASLALDAGRVLVGFGGNDGDCGNYHGWLESIPEAGTAGIARFEVARGHNQGRGAVWMGGAAPSVDAAGNVYVADGNGNAVSAGDAFDYSDAVLKLSATMRLEDYYAPSTFYSDNASDLDLGSGAPELLGGGLLLQVGKTETGYVLSSSNLGHVTSAARTFPVCVGKGQANGADALANGLVVVPCSGGLDAVRVSALAPYGTVVWSTGVVGTSPVYGDGLIWSVAGYPGGSTLYALDAATGALRFQYDLGGTQNHFVTPAIGDNLVLVAAATELVAIAPR